MTEARYRRRAGQRWHAARLRHVTALAGAPGRYVVELADTRTGGTRTLTTAAWQIDVRDHGRWRPLAAWATGTGELFDPPPT